MRSAATAVGLSDAAAPRPSNLGVERPATIGRLPDARRPLRSFVSWLRNDRLASSRRGQPQERPRAVSLACGKRLTFGAGWAAGLFSLALLAASPARRVVEGARARIDPRRPSSSPFTRLPAFL